MQLGSCCCRCLRASVAPWFKQKLNSKNKLAQSPGPRSLAAQMHTSTQMHSEPPSLGFPKLTAVNSGTKS